MKHLYPYLRRFRKESILAPLFKMLEATFDLLVPMVVADIIKVGIAGGDTTYIWTRCGLLVLMALIGLLCSFTAQYFAARAAIGTSTGLRHELMAHIQSLSFSELDTLGVSTLITRMTSDVNQVQNGLNMFLRLFLRSPFIVAGAMIAAFTIDTQIALIFLAAIPVLAVIVFGIMRITSPMYKTVQSRLDAVTGATRENLSGVRVVRAFGQQEREVEKFDRVNNDLRKKNLRLNELLAIYWGGGDAISMTQTLLTLVVCIIYACNGWITVGTLIVFTSTLGMLLFPIRQLGRTLSDAGKAMVSMKRVQAILHEEAEPDEPNALKPDLHGDIVFDHVSFAYPDDNVPVLRDVSFTIPAGKTAAVLGGTGSGKSTMMYLLQRLYAPTSGKITIGGVDIQQIDRKYLRAHVGLILQEPFLYSKSIRENVGITAPEQEAERIEHAADIASASGFIAKADKGWETVVGERGVTLSGGQKQRIAIARTLLKDNNILIFDDSLSAVDTETDAQIRAALRHEQKDVTTLIISHRVTTLSQADLILVLENGQITQQGTHAELCSQPGLYQRINSIQNALEEELTQAKAAEGVN